MSFSASSSPSKNASANAIFTDSMSRKPEAGSCGYVFTPARTRPKAGILAFLEEALGFADVFLLAIFISSQQANNNFAFALLKREIDSISIIEFDLTQAMTQI